MNKIYLPDEIYGIIYSYCTTLDKIKLMGILNNDLYLLDHIKNIKRAKRKLKQLRGLNKKVKNQRKQIKQLTRNRITRKELELKIIKIRHLKHDIVVTKDIYRKFFIKTIELNAELDIIKKNYILVKKSNYPQFLTTHGLITLKK